MNSVLMNILVSKNPKRFEEVKDRARKFNSDYNGNNIIQDDIFHVMENYAKKHDTQLEVMRIPVRDDDFCGFTCVRKGVIFVVINSYLPIAKQIFAAAHELYHIVCYMDEQDSSLLQMGSLLTADRMDEEVCNSEDIEANAFAGLLLVSQNNLNDQMAIYGIDKRSISVDDVITLMEIFAVPYKAVVFRLYEEDIIKKNKALEFLRENGRVVEEKCALNNKATRWLKRTEALIDMAGLDAIIENNDKQDILPDRRIKEDKERLADLICRLKRGSEA